MRKCSPKNLSFPEDEVRIPDREHPCAKQHCNPAKQQEEAKSKQTQENNNQIMNHNGWPPLHIYQVHLSTMGPIHMCHQAHASCPPLKLRSPSWRYNVSRQCMWTWSNMTESTWSNPVHTCRWSIQLLILPIFTWGMLFSLLKRLMGLPTHFIHLMLTIMFLLAWG